MTVGRDEWMQEGTCAQSDPDLWFSPGAELEAAMLCEACPVLEQCRVYAQGFTPKWGVIAGMLPSERGAKAARRVA